MVLPLLAAVPVWVWITGAVGVGAVVAIDKSTDLADETGQALEAGTDLGKVVLAGAVLYVSYRALQSAGALK